MYIHTFIHICICIYTYIYIYRDVHTWYINCSIGLRRLTWLAECEWRAHLLGCAAHLPTLLANCSVVVGRPGNRPRAVYM